MQWKLPRQLCLSLVAGGNNSVKHKNSKVTQLPSVLECFWSRSGAVGTCCRGLTSAADGCKGLCEVIHFW